MAKNILAPLFPTYPLVSVSISVLPFRLIDSSIALPTGFILFRVMKCCVGVTEARPSPLC